MNKWIINYVKLYVFFACSVLTSVYGENVSERLSTNGKVKKIKESSRKKYMDNGLVKKLCNQAPSLDEFPSYVYPNEKFNTIPVSHEGKVLLFGYGSLMKKCSVGVNGKQTIKDESSNTIRPVVALNLKRIYNYHDQREMDTRKYVGEENERACLNVTKSPGSITNGVVMEVDLDDLACAIKREHGYDLKPVVVVDWQSLLDNPSELRFEVAYTFCASDEKRTSIFNPQQQIHYTNNEILPVRRYADYVKAAADDFGALFSLMYDETTYLSDGMTLIYQWDRTKSSNEKVKEYERLRKNNKSISL